MPLADGRPAGTGIVAFRTARPLAFAWQVWVPYMGALESGDEGGNRGSHRLGGTVVQASLGRAQRTVAAPAMMLMGSPLVTAPAFIANHKIYFTVTTVTAGQAEICGFRSYLTVHASTELQIVIMQQRQFLANEIRYGAFDYT